MSHAASNDTPLVIVGNALAGLVAATERARHGQRTLVVNPGGPWGGYFAGLQAGGQRWDTGLVLYEFTSFRTPAEAPPVSSYDAKKRNDIGRFTHAVRDYIAARQATRDVAPLQMWTGDRVLPDLLLGNGLTALPQLACAHAATDELRHLLPAATASPWHASRKNEWPLLGAADIDTVSRLNHGNVLHEAVIAPFARQLLNGGAAHLSALFHRIPWLPLYWPQTLLAALEGRPTGLPETLYSHPVGGCVADLCAQLAAQMQTDPLITLRQERVTGTHRTPQGFALQLEHSGRVTSARLAWAQTPRQGLAACGVPLPPAVEERLPLMLVFLRLPRAALRREFSVLHAVAPDSGVYRVGHVSGCAGDDISTEVRLVVEAHPARFEAQHGVLADDAQTVRAVLADLLQLGIVAPACQTRFAHVLRLPGALPLPTPASLAAYENERAELLRRLPGIEPIANSAGAYATSLSDQIVQGLVLAGMQGAEHDSARDNTQDNDTRFTATTTQAAASHRAATAAAAFI